MRICAFGTLRLDIHAYQDINDLAGHEEIKIPEMSMKVGGSVFNTVAVLHALKQDVTFYTLNMADDFADFVKFTMNKINIEFITSRQDKNETATSLIFIGEDGQKKMISHDGERRDKYVLDKLYRDVDQYDLFYTSFYEINSVNCEKVIQVMKKSPCSFVDMSPLIYETETEVLEKILTEADYLSGTEDEYEIIFSKTGIKTPEELIRIFAIRKAFLKQGKRGATMYEEGETLSYTSSASGTSRDTTGCGDTFNAGVIYGLCKEETGDSLIERAVEMATKVAFEGFSPELFAM